MKPFRGKPKKPKRSNGEIHRQRRWLRVGGRCPAVPFDGSRAGTLPCVDVRPSSSCTSPLVGRRDPLGVGLRPGCGDCRVAGKTARGKLPVARPAARRYTQRYQAAPRARRARRKRAPRSPEVTDPVPSPVLARCWLSRCHLRQASRPADTRGSTGRRRYCFGYSQDPS